MITIYRTIDGTLRQVSDYESWSWVNVVAPTSEEIADLAARFLIPLDFLTDPLDVWERARMDRDEGRTLIVLRTARRDLDETEIPFKTLPIGVILAGETLITICLTEVDVLQEFISGRVRGISTERQTRFILQLFLRSTLLFLISLKEINRMSNTVEKNLHKAMKNEELIRLMNYEKSLVYFTTSLRSNALMIEKFKTHETLRLSEEDRDLLEDIIVESRQAIEMANIYSDILSDMMDAFASVISNNLNVVMKLLTTVTILIMLPTLIASIYGMNIELPFQHSPDAFFITMTVSMVLCISGIIIFWRKDFL